MRLSISRDAISSFVCDKIQRIHKRDSKIAWMDKPVRKSPRLKKYDYSLCGTYFLTICAHHHHHLFGRVEFEYENNSIILSDIGLAVKKILENLTERFPEFEIIKYSIMPNHLHILVLKSDSIFPTRHTVSDFVCVLKSLATRETRLKHPGMKIWQESFHDHIIRDEKDFSKHWDYIDQNVNNWKKDKFFS